MQIVIEIDEERFDDIQRIASVQTERRTETVEQIIAKGVVLPKGHGDLIDRNELKMYGSWQMQIIPEGNGKYVETKIYTQRAVDAMPTIIPAADKEESK